MNTWMISWVMIVAHNVTRFVKENGLKYEALTVAWKSAFSRYSVQTAVFFYDAFKE